MRRRWHPLLLALLVAACQGGDRADEPATTGGTVDDDPMTSVPVTDPETGDAASESATAAPTTTAPPSATDAADGVEPEGFTAVTVVITEPSGERCEWCMWLADDAAERGRGLMGVTDLGDADGMVFAYTAPQNGAFYMFQTPTPLSIAWFAADGAFVAATEMEPCLDTPAADCTRYTPGPAYTHAVEVFAGGLDALGIGPGAVLEVVAGTERPDCARPAEG